MNIRYILVLFFLVSIYTFNCYGKEPKTVITGDQIKIMSGGKKVEFSGNSKVVRGKNMLKADRLIQDKQKNVVEAYGNVRFFVFTKDGEPIKGSSERAIYDLDKGKGELWKGRPTIEYELKGTTGPVKLQANRIKFDNQTEQIYAEGNVCVISSSATAYSQEIVFNQKSKKMILTGKKNRPKIIFLQEDKEATYSSDKITVFADEHKIYFEGNVLGKMVIKEQVKK